MLSTARRSIGCLKYHCFCRCCGKASGRKLMQSNDQGATVELLYNGEGASLFCHPSQQMLNGKDKCSKYQFCCSPSNIFVPHGKTTYQVLQRVIQDYKTMVFDLYFGKCAALFKHVKVKDNEKLKCLGQIESIDDNQAFPHSCRLTCSDNDESIPMLMEF